MCAWDSQMLRNKHNFVISIIAINMFYSTCKGFNFIVTYLAFATKPPCYLRISGLLKCACMFYSYLLIHSDVLQLV